MADYIHSLSITGIAAALCHAMGAEAPEHAAPPVKSLETLVHDYTQGQGADRLFMYNPDAIGLWLYQKYTEKFDPVLRHTQLNVPLCTVMPSVTPVCFASLYTGAQPEVHGIRKYEKPVVRTDTVFDALIRTGKRIAIIADTGCSIAKIFLEREMDYFIYDTIEEINRKVHELIEQDRHDMIVVYHTDYDASCTKTAPRRTFRCRRWIKTSPPSTASAAPSKHTGSSTTRWWALPWTTAATTLTTAAAATGWTWRRI